jgi:hypothetical protein
LADKPWLKALFVDFLREKNTAEWLADLANKLKRTGQEPAVAQQRRARQRPSSETGEGGPRKGKFREGEASRFRIRSWLYIFASLDSNEKPEKPKRSSVDDEEGKEKHEKPLLMKFIPSNLNHTIGVRMSEKFWSDVDNVSGEECLLV